MSEAAGGTFGGTFSSGARRLAGLTGVLLGWPPDQFWRATPAELAAVIAVLGGGAGDAPVDGALLRRLQEAFPDG